MPKFSTLSKKIGPRVCFIFNSGTARHYGPKDNAVEMYESIQPRGVPRDEDAAVQLDNAWAARCLLDRYVLFFRTKAREEPGFELTKPSTGQELQQTTKLQRSEGYNGNTGLKR